MRTTDKIREYLAEIPQLCHASNIIGKYDGVKDAGTQKALNAITKEYYSYLSSMLAISGIDEDSVRLKVGFLNEYYNFIHNQCYDNLFSAQGKFRPTILEEFLFLLFKDVVAEKKAQYDNLDVLSSGSVKAYTNIYFRAKDLQDFIQRPEIGVNEKDQDYAIYRTFDISVNNAPTKRIQIPAVAIEAKTYIDKTMLDGIIATAEKLKNGNPYTRFVAVAERYDVSLDVDPSYSRIDQIYILRKGMKKGEWKDIDAAVVLRLYNETVEHLDRPWSDVQKRLEEDGVIL